MTVPAYTEDLTDIATGDEASGWVELTGTDQNGEAYNANGAPAYEDEEYPYIQGLYAVTQDTTKSTSVGSLAYSSGGVTVPTDGAIIVWHNYSSPFAFGSYAQGGYRICVGSSLADFNVWYVGGNDKGRMPYGGFECHAVNPNDPTGAGESQLARDNYAGTATATLDYIGSAVYVVSGPSKGEPHQVDVMRYGRCSAILEYGETSNYATIAGFATQNDNQTNRWGLIQATPGGYLWKGRLQLGTATNAVDFRDSSKTIFIDWTPKVSVNFNLIEIINAASNVEMTGFTFLCLDTSTASPGRLLMTDKADVALDTCTFVDMDTFVFSDDATNVVTIESCIFRRCGQVTQGGATFTSCSFDAPSGAVGLLVDSLAIVTGCTFTSDGTGHGLNLGTISTTTGVNWNNDDSGYTASSSGNETILVSVASGQTLTINVGTGYTTPSVYNTGTGDVSVVSGQVTTQIKVVKAADTSVNIESARVLVWPSDGTNFPYQVTVSITGTATTATVAHTAHGLATGDDVIIEGVINDDRYNGAFSITVTTVNAYTYITESTIVSTPATGTIISTFAFINGDTNSSGLISDTRTVSSNQAITGRVRKSSSSPYYQQGNISGTIDNASGYTATIQMVGDE